MAATGYVVTTGGGGMTGLVGFLVLLVLGGVLLARYQQQQAEEKVSDEAAALKKREAALHREEEKKKKTPTHPKAVLTPQEKKNKDISMRFCESLDNQNGTCAYDDDAKTYYLKCKAPFFGPSCNMSCDPRGDAPRKYTPGINAGGTSKKAAAVCACPAENQFADTNVIRGCKAAKDGASNCKPGYHGRLCTEEGAYKDCGPHGTQSGGSCVCKFGYDGEKCEYKTSRCNAMDPHATPNDDGSCACSAGYLSKPGTSGAAAVCDECDTLSGYYKKGNRCVSGTICELNVVGKGTSAGGLRNAAGAAKTFQMGAHGVSTVENVQLKRVSGSGICAARLHTDSGCDLEVTLPAGHTSLTSFPLEATTKGQTGRGVRSITLGEQGAVAVTGAQRMCTAHQFDTSDTADCPSSSGNVCAFYWTSVKP